MPHAPSKPAAATALLGRAGPPTDYGIAYVEESATPDRINVSAYRGHIAGSDIVRRTIGCNGLGINVAGRAFLGESLSAAKVSITSNVNLVGLPLAMQGFAFGSGPCVAQLRFSDTIDFTIR